MSDNYQAVYDAIRSRFHVGDVGTIISEEIRRAFDISYAIPGIVQEFNVAAYEMQRPFVLLKPKMYPDGNMWCALYGENIQEGVAGFGETPAKAAIDFDIHWLNEKAKSPLG